MPRTLSPAEVERIRGRLEGAAEQLILRRGGAEFTMRELANAIGCSPMLAYRYYKDKDEIVAAVRANAFRKFAEALEAAGQVTADPAARSYQVGEAYVRFALDHSHLYRLMFSLAPVPSGRYPALDEAMARARRTITSHVEGLVKEGLLMGDPEIIGHMFWASLHGLIVLELAGQLAPEPGFARLRSAVTDTLVKGLRRDPR